MMKIEEITITELQHSNIDTQIKDVTHTFDWYARTFEQAEPLRLYLYR